MGGLLLIWLFIDFCVLLIKLWWLVLLIVATRLLWRRVIKPWCVYRVQELHERLRHERARQEIERIESVTARAMFAAARLTPQRRETHQGRAVARRQP